jgi:hypothetical protein
MSASPQDLLASLREAAATIRSLEAAAAEAMYERGDEAGYRQHYQEKCELLMDMPERVAPFLTGLEPDLARKIGAEAESYARRAGQALDMDSIFYMYALLYPDDYQDGQPNDLERFIDGVAARLG